ncbi:MAG: hypothetical protein HY336_02440 [Candidatus Doudnabacteria bacterium]|nr:hypothetical protein [Candidatus Doudnabacteria bacterium]
MSESAIDLVTIAKVWGYYFLPFLPGSPEIGTLSEADCVCAQSFGRRNFEDSELPWIHRLRRSLGDDKKTLEWLESYGFDPGPANLELARITINLACSLGSNGDILPIFTQWEIAFALYSIDRDWFEYNLENIVVLWPPLTLPYWTHNLLKDFRKSARKKGLRKPLLLASDLMLARVIPIAWRLGINLIIPSKRLGLGKKQSLDRLSIQPHTQRLIWWNPWRCWIFRESFGRCYHIRRGLVSFRPPR